MGQEQWYANHDDLQVLEFSAVFTQSKAHLSDGIDRECSNINFIFHLSTRYSAHEHRFLSKLNYLDFVSVKY